MEQKTIYIVDDNADFRDSTAWWLEGAGYEVQCFADPSEAIDTLTASALSNEACLLLDVRMPEMSGLDFHDRLNERSINIPVIYMTGHGDIPIAVEAMKKGAITYLEKPLNGSALDLALQTAFEQYRQSKLNTASPHVPEREPCPIFAARLASLSPRELEVMEGIINGDMNKVIAYNLGISVKTIEIHRSQVKKKMQVKNMAELIKMAVTQRVE